MYNIRKIFRDIIMVYIHVCTMFGTRCYVDDPLQRYSMLIIHLAMMHMAIHMTKLYVYIIYVYVYACIKGLV